MLKRRSLTERCVTHPVGTWSAARNNWFAASGSHARNLTTSYCELIFFLLREVVSRYSVFFALFARAKMAFTRASVADFSSEPLGRPCGQSRHPPAHWQQYRQCGVVDVRQSSKSRTCSVSYCWFKTRDGVEYRNALSPTTTFLKGFVIPSMNCVLSASSSVVWRIVVPAIE